ncbi:hypothetical protein N0V83_008028 [Neocucurbitaria cava]|uniref:Gfd2/YDR514C-like C-terminal domain-containing protein n=1 Tax=Neocucurbitaria cava TaxID=798079 RepID=A0A9W9CK59_9PLEO|nr:hypothetical protein N0V83_008028 [Neocucurbitaria cava]
MSPPLYISDLLARGNAVQAYNELRAISRVPKSTAPAITEPVTCAANWEASIRFIAEGPNGIHIIRGKGRDKKKNKAVELAYRDALENLVQASDVITDIGCGQHHAATTQPRTLPGPTKNPTEPQARIIARARSHLETANIINKRVTDCHPTRIIVLDVEKHTRTGGLLEVGIVDIMVNSKQLGVEHYIVQEEINEPGSRIARPYEFAYGASRTLSKAIIVTQLNVLIQDLKSMKGVVYLSGHTVCNDIKWLQEEGADFSELPVIDVSEVEKAQRSTHQAISLERLGFQSYNVRIRGDLHNAGNDAVLTAGVLVSQLTALAQDGNQMEWVMQTLDGFADEICPGTLGHV